MYIFAKSNKKIMNITKQDKKQISKMIKGLMPCFHKTETEKVTISGHALLAKGVKTLKDGQEVIPTGIYVTTQPKSINHKTEAEKHFKKSGFQGVAFYVASIKSLEVNS